MEIRAERAEDTDAIRTLTTAAFLGRWFSDGTEAAVVDGLRDANALTLSLVASIDGQLVGHIAFSAVTIDGSPSRWFGLGPVSVSPDQQRGGIGSALVREGLASLTSAGAGGCVLFGGPSYYRRFGFENQPKLWCDMGPAEHFMALSLNDPVPSGQVRFHPAFLTPKPNSEH